MKEMRKRLKKQEKRANHKAVYMAQCMECNLLYNSDEEAILFENELALSAEHILAKSSYGKDKSKDDEVILPLRVTLGITMSLAGFFIWMVPMPICKIAGQVVMDIGVGFLIDASVTEYEERQKKE